MNFFKKAGFLMFLAIIFLTGLIFAEDKKVSEIEIQGNKNVSRSKILETITTKKGEILNESTLDEDLQKIHALGSFFEESVETEPAGKGVKVIFQVKEKPFIQKIEIKGNKDLSQGNIKDVVSLKKNEAFDQKMFEDDQEKIINHYRDKGYLEAKVEGYTKVNEENGKLTVTFFITEGKKVTIGQVNITGNQYLTRRKILHTLKIKPKKIYKQENVEKGIETLTDYYLDRGFVEVRISSPSFTYNEDRTKVKVDIQINEGVSYRLAKIEFTNHTIFTEKQLRKMLLLKENKIYNHTNFKTSKENIQSAYADKGYLYLRIEPQQPLPEMLDRTNQTLHLVINLQEGPLVYVNKILIEGNEVTKDYVIRREFLLGPDDPFSSKKVKRSLEKIYNLGYFENVDVDTLPGDSENSLNLVIEVKEQKTGLLTLGAGYSSVDKILATLQIQQINLFGKGWRLALSTELGPKKNSYEVRFTEPWLLGTRNSLGLNFYDTLRRNLQYTSPEITKFYSQRKKGADIQLGHTFTDALSLYFTYGYKKEELTDIGDIQQLKDSQSGATSSLSTLFVEDSRDNVFNASRGSRNTFSYQIAGGYLKGDNSFNKFIVESNWFFPVFWKFVFAVSARSGLVAKYGQSEIVPVYEKFQVGGAETIRGYNNGALSPFGGSEAMLVLNAEYKVTIPETPLQLAVFYDAGNGWDSFRKMVLKIGGLNQNHLKQGVGVGLRFITPVFPIRLDYGYGLDHPAAVREKGQWYFTIGQIF